MSCAQAWAWGDVPAILRTAGHVVIAPDLPLVRPYHDEPAETSAI